MTPKRKELSCFQRGQIIGAWKMGTTLRKIAQMLDYPHSTVQKVIKAYKDYGYAKPPPRKGRPKVLTERNKRALLRVVKKDRKAILTGKILYTITTSHTVNSLLTFILTLILYKEIKNNLTDSTSKVVSEKTIQRELHESGYFGRVGARKPYVDERNRKKRLNWAKERKSWKSEWEKVIWSDESYFRLFNGDGRRWVWRQPMERYKADCLIPTQKSKQDGIMVWGCFHKNGLGPLVRLEGRVNSRDYINLLQGRFLPYLDTLGDKENFVFQEDNAPIHKSRLSTEWKANNNLINLPWPPQSPDLNPIEHLWDVLERKIRARGPLPKNKEKLWQRLQEEWLQIDNSVIQTLVDSMPRRVAAVIDSKGSPTKY